MPIADLLLLANGFISNKSRLLTYTRLQQPLLKILHPGHFKMPVMESLAQSTGHWPDLDNEMTDVRCTCQACAEHLARSKTAITPSWIIQKSYGSESV